MRSPARSRNRAFFLLLLSNLASSGCREPTPASAAPPASSVTHPPSGEGALSTPLGDAGTWVDATVAPPSAPVYGEPLPEQLLIMEMSGEQVRMDTQSFVPSRTRDADRLAERVRGRDVLLTVGDPDTFLAQVSDTLAVLRAQGASVWLRHPDAPVAYRLVLRDEEGFREWLAEVAPGKLRIIQRADGFELATSVGKLPGPDRNGPSVPVRAGRQDIATLRRELSRLKGRFTTSEDLCLVPSFGTELAQVARALGGTYVAPGDGLFDTLCLVYPTPRPARDAGTP
ncbi:hypothetical protein GTY96_35210 [Corallococcus sp. c25j21]|nr:hypothetical protein [Corallococcus silvisoli]